MRPFAIENQDGLAGRIRNGDQSLGRATNPNGSHHLTRPAPAPTHGGKPFTACIDPVDETEHGVGDEYHAVVSHGEPRRNGQTHVLRRRSQWGKPGSRGHVVTGNSAMGPVGDEQFLIVNQQRGRLEGLARFIGNELELKHAVMAVGQDRSPRCIGDENLAGLVSRHRNRAGRPMGVGGYASNVTAFKINPEHIRVTLIAYP